MANDDFYKGFGVSKDEIEKVNLDEWNEDGVNVKEEEKRKAVEESIKSGDEEAFNKKIAGKINAVKALLHAKAFGRAQTLLEEVENAELGRKDSEGYCDNPEVFWCKVLLKNQARDEADLISKKPDLENDEDFLLALEWSKTDGQRQGYQSVLDKIKQAENRGGNNDAAAEKYAEKEKETAREAAPSAENDLTNKKLKRVSRLIDAGEFDEAKERLDKIEQEEEDRTGDCEIPQVYHYKMLLDYKARTDGELIAALIEKQEDITQNKNYRLAKSCAEDADDDDEFDALLAIKKKAADGINKAKAEAEAKAKAEAEAHARAEAERKRREEEERKKREEEERKRKAEEERKRKEEALKALKTLGDYKDIGGGYVTFGAYPQSKKAGSVQIGQVYDSERGYYLGSDNCLYEKYNNEYYKVEPIKWKVLSRGSKMFIVADDILDAHCFSRSDNNYANSEIRSWLNGEFYKKAFTEAQRNIILTTTVDNSVASTGRNTNKNVCGNTYDKIFLLSRKEAEQYLNCNEARRRVPTEYAIARGAKQYSGTNSDIKRDGKGCGWWLLRSPDDKYLCDVQDSIGGGFRCDQYYQTDLGVVPALQFNP